MKEKASWDAWKVKRVKRNVRIERGESMRSLKRRKMTVEGIDCHIRNPKCRFFTTVSGSTGDDDIWGFLRRDCPRIFAP